MQTVCTIDRRSAAACAALGAARRSRRRWRAAAGGCNTDSAGSTGGTQFRPTTAMRHPIAIKEGQTDAGSCSSAPAAAGCRRRSGPRFCAFAQNWQREATGGVIVDRPVGGSNERAAADTLAGDRCRSSCRQRRAPQGIGVRPYQPQATATATMRLNYPQDRGARPDLAACGRTTSGRATNRKHFENQPVLQLRLRHAAQPRRHGRQPGRSGAAARRDAGLHDAKRTFGVDKWRKGESPATVYTDQSTKGAISDVGK